MMAKKPTNLPAAQTGRAVAKGGMDFRRDAGGGKANVDAESLAMPFLKVLQKGSPEVDEDSGKTLKGAKAGMFFETTSQRMTPGDKGIKAIPCNFRRRFIWWGPKFGQFKGQFSPEEAKKMMADEKVTQVDNQWFFPLNGKVDEKKCDRLVDTREHYFLIIGKGYYQRILFPLNSTQIKKSRHLNSVLDEYREEDKNGSYAVPTYAHIINATTAVESNDEGTWFGVNFMLDRLLQEKSEEEIELYQIAKSFSESIDENKVTTNYANLAPEDEDETRETPGRRRGF